MQAGNHPGLPRPDQIIALRLTVGTAPGAVPERSCRFSSLGAWNRTVQPRRTNLGAALRKAGRFEDAITANQEAAAIFRQTGDDHREGKTRNNPEIA